MQAMMNPRKSVGTAYLAYSGRLLAEVADELGKADDAANYRGTAANAVKAYRAAFTENGVIKSDRQCEYVRAIAFALLGEDESKAAAARSCTARGLARSRRAAGPNARRR